MRLGFQHTQLTNHDDVLNLDMIATPDVSSYGMFGSYRIPLIRPSILALRVFGSYGDFVANDANFQAIKFGGKNWLEGVELTNRTSLFRGWELASSAGVNSSHYEIKTEFSGSSSKKSAEFVTPFVNLALTREGEWWSVGVGLRFEDSRSIDHSAENSQGYIDLGREGAAAHWTSLRWNVGGALYLEPLFNHGEKTAVLANEFSLRARGRKLLRGHRLIPQEEEPLGGALTVRGYPEAIVSADELTLATAEYAFHVSRALKPGEPGHLLGRSFNWRPPQANQNADWDLVLRSFYDYAYRSVASFAGSTSSAALADRSFGFSGLGVGAELLLWRNLSVRCDVGMALTEIKDYPLSGGQQIIVRSGSGRAHIVSSLSW
jgi:hemolysin activation/secretion protein